MMTRLLQIGLMAMALGLAQPADAHGTAKARHGGAVATVNDLNFELVGGPAGALLYIDDHGQPMSPNGFAGRLTVLHGTEKTEAQLVVAGDRMEAPGVKLARGAKAVATLTSPAKGTMTVRFAVK